MRAEAIAPKAEPARGPGGELRFLVDHMLIKLGKYLRIAGYDAEWDTTQRTHELIKRANAEQRVFVTRNKRLASQYPAPDRVVTLTDPDPVWQFHSIVAKLHLDAQRGLFTQCIRCNVALEDVPAKAAIRGKVHRNVYAQQDRFTTCPRCHTVFWYGSHVRNTCRKLSLAPP